MSRMTPLFLQFRHCIERGAEHTHIDSLVKMARERFRGFYAKDKIHWRERDICRFDYTIPLFTFTNERQHAISELLGISLPRGLVPLGLPREVRVCGDIYLLPQVVRIDASHTEVGGFILGPALRPIIKGVTKKTIIMMARESKLLLTEE